MFIFANNQVSLWKVFAKIYVHLWRQQIFASSDYNAGPHNQKLFNFTKKSERQWNEGREWQIKDGSNKERRKKTMTCQNLKVTSDPKV